VILAGCGGGESANLRALKNDPIARYEPPGGRLVDSDEQDEGSTLGKPVYAEYRRMFELRRGDPERQFEHAVDAAVAAGWVMLDAEPFHVDGAMAQSGNKRLPTGRASIAITVFPDGPPSGESRVPTLLLRLRHFD
jgi:hypothetical protein